MDCGQHIIRIARIYKNRRYPFKDQLTRTVFATALPKVVVMASADMGGDFCARGDVRAAGLFSFTRLLLLMVTDCLPYAVTDLRCPRFYFFCGFYGRFRFFFLRLRLRLLWGRACIFYLCIL